MNYTIENEKLNTMKVSFKKIACSLTTVALSLSLSSSALAGAVSGGGGGLTNPHPADPEWVMTSVREYAGPIILMMLNQQEEVFERLTDDAKLKSPYFKLFRPQNGKSIFEIVKQTKVEVRMSEPCLDAAGLPFDGSMYASQPDSICISAFTMAPKLNEHNVAAETVALVLHELSHLAGTTEAEATEIQYDAVWPINEREMLDAVVQVHLLAESYPTGRLGEPILGLDYWIKNPSEIKASDMDSLSDQLLDLRDDKLNMSGGYLNLLGGRSARLLTPQFVGIRAIRDFICSVDPNEDTGVRDYCAERLKLGFGSDDKVTARTYLMRTSSIDHGPEFDDVWIQKLSTLADVSVELTQIHDYLSGIHAEIRELDKFKTSVYRK